MNQTELTKQAVPETRNHYQWWAAIILIVLIGGALRFVGYNAYLPYISDIDESILNIGTLSARGLYNQYYRVPGYSPGIFWVDGFSQFVVEQATHRSAEDNTADTIAVSRFLAATASTLVIIFIALTAREIKGATAGIIAAAAWAVAPIIINETISAKTAAWVGLMSALALYLAVLAMKKRQPKWTILSIFAGLIAIIFKYASLPALLPGFMAALWQLWSVRQIARSRNLWIRTIAIQWGCIVIVAAWLFLVYGAGRLIGTHREVNEFVNNGATKVFDIPFAMELLNDTAIQVGLALWVSVTIILAGLAVLYLSATRRERLTPRFPLGTETEGKIVCWLIVAVFTFVSVWFTTTYQVLHTPPETDYYLIPANLGLIVLLAISLTAGVEFIVSLFRYRVVSFVALVVIMLVWLAPLAASAVINTQKRLLPDTRNAFAAWSISALDPGSILVSLSSPDILNKEWGGYTGPYRVWIGTPLQARSRTDWIGAHVLYAQLDREEIDKLQLSADGRAYLDQLLPLKQFPPAGQENSWHGPQMVIYRLWRMQHELNAGIGPQIKLLGYDLDPAAPKAGDTLTLTLYWQAIHKPSDNYNVYVHLFPMDSRTVIAQADGAPLAYSYPTSAWDDPTETLISRPFQLTLPAKLPAGQYRLGTGLYNYQTGQRLPVGDTDFVQLTVITIPPVSPGKSASSPQEFDF